jgi:HTH-type transcriptional regulator, transcriptional repressor of NAD biosynthesis genes
MTRALVLGKFRPLHQGHLLLLNAAKLVADQVTVMLDRNPSDRWPATQRQEWIQKEFPEFFLVSLDVPLIDPKLDSEGIATNELYWDYWIRLIYLHGPFDYVVSSDRYGKEIAKRINAKWVPVDPDREVMPISATSINQNIEEHWQWIAQTAREDLALKIAIVGAESVGKSTLAMELANVITHATYVPEYGRIFSVERNHKLNRDDFLFIKNMQASMVRQACQHYPIIIADTEHHTTDMFYQIYLGGDDDLVTPGNVTYDHYVLLDPSVPWVHDGDRVTGDLERWKWHEKWLKVLEENNLPYSIIQGCNYGVRTQMVKLIVKTLISDRRENYNLLNTESGVTS